MTFPIGQKIRMIRDAEGLTRAAFADLLETKEDTIANIEKGNQRARSDVLEAIGKQWPEYAYWLLTGKTDPKAGHISPAIEDKRKDSDERGVAG